MKKIKILHIIDTPGPGGAEKVLHDIIVNLDKNKFQSFLVLSESGWLSSELECENIHIDIIKGGGTLNLKYLIELYRYVKQNQFDIIHAHLSGVSLYCSFVSRITSIPMISTFHGYVDVPEKLPRLKIYLIFKFARKIIFVSNHLRDYFQNINKFQSKKTEVIYNGINVQEYQRADSDFLRQELGLSNEDILIGSVGNITHSKGYEILLKAAFIVCSSYPNVKFLIAGEKRGVLYDTLEKMRFELGLNENVFFVGYRSRIASFMKGLDLYVLSSLAEGFSLSTIEALAAGLPVIVTRSGGPTEIVENNVNGLIVPADNSEALAEAIEKILKDKEIRDYLTIRSQEIVSDKFGIKKMIQKYCDIYSEITNNN